MGIIKSGGSRAIFIGAVAMPLLAGLYELSWVRAHYDVAALGGVLWEGTCVLAVFPAGLARQVLAGLQEIWSKRIQAAIERRTQKWLPVSWSGWRGYEQSYRLYIEQLCKNADQSGLPSLPPKPARLDAIFIDVSLVYRGTAPMTAGLVGHQANHGGGAERRSVWDFLADGDEPKYLAIVGVPGSGKTTLLRHVAMTLARQRAEHLPRRLPVLLPLTGCVAQVTTNPRVRLAAVINASLAERYDAPGGWFEDKLTAGECVVLLDGLDEVAGIRDRQRVATWIQEQQAIYSRNDFLVTSRPYAYRDDLLSTAEQLQLRELTQDQVERFIRNWYAETRWQHPAGNAAGQDWDTPDQLIRRLRPRTASAPQLAELAVNPLLLMMIFTIYRYSNRGQLPDTRAALYAAICTVMLENPPRARGNAALRLPKGASVAVLRELAYTMMADRKTSAPDAAARAVIGAALATVTGTMDPGAFLEAVQANGLLIEDEGDYIFAHHTFQEYLASDAIRDEARLNDLVTHLGDSWWREVVLLRAARLGADPIVAAGLADGRLPALSLAVECADADPRLDPGLRGQIDELLWDAANPAVGPERRRLATALTAERHLRATVKLANGGRACVLPVPLQLYDLYTHEKEGSYPEWTPAATRPSVTPMPPEPALGVSAAEAAAFVDWLGALPGAEPVLPASGSACRLPTQAEVTDPVFRDLPAVRQRSVWVLPDDGSGEPVLWCAPGTPHPDAVTSGELRERADADLAGTAGTQAAIAVSLALVQSLAISGTLARAQGVRSGRSAAVAGQFRASLDLAVRLGYQLADLVTSDPDEDRRAVLQDSLGRARLDAAPPLVPTGDVYRAADLSGHLHARASDLATVLEAVLQRATGISIPRPGERFAGRGTALSAVIGAGLDARLDGALLDGADLDVGLCALYARAEPGPDSASPSGVLFGAMLHAAIDERPQRVVAPDALPRLARDAGVRIAAMVPPEGMAHLHRRSAVVAGMVASHADGLVAMDKADVLAAVPGVRLARSPSRRPAAGSARHRTWSSGTSISPPRSRRRNGAPAGRSGRMRSSCSSAPRRGTQRPGLVLRRSTASSEARHKAESSR